MHKRLRSSLAGIRMVSLAWSGSVGRFATLCCGAVVCFLLGLGANLVLHDPTLAVHRVHTQPILVTKTEPVALPIVPRIINGPVVQQGSPDVGVHVPAPANTDQPPLAKTEEPTDVTRAVEPETRQNVRCLSAKALQILYAIESAFGRVLVISTCRPGAVIAGTDHPSKHGTGNAIDFVAPAGRRGEVIDWLVKNHRAGGVMTYEDSEHIHVDIGPHFVSLAGDRRGRSRRHSGDDDD
jgi:Peptidase M15